MTLRQSTSFTLLSIVFGFFILSGCSNQPIRSNSNLVEYLYPTEQATKIESSTPTLKLPLKIGIAFVPDQSEMSSGHGQRKGRPDALTAAKKDELLNKIADNFRKEKFIADIQVIPSDYLRPRGSFANLSQIKNMYDIDVIALVSFDQVQYTDGSFLSLSYWTLVGAYTVSGEKNDTSTLLDIAIYDINSQKMLFRAPGNSHVKGRSTPINLNEELRLDSVKGFDLATNDMITNLEQAMNNFRKKIKENPNAVKISH